MKIVDLGPCNDCAFSLHRPFGDDHMSTEVDRVDSPAAFKAGRDSLLDAQYLEAFRRGDRETIERVYHEYFNIVERTVRRTLARAGRFVAADVNDVVQEVFAKAFLDGARARYDGERPYVAFLRVVARSVLVDWLRRAGRRVPGHPGAETVDDLTDTESEPGTLPTPEQIGMIRRYLYEMDSELYAVYHLRFIVGEGQIEAARTLGISRQSLRTLERKLIEGLRRRFSGEPTTH
jgi:RNA polymerase sigma factor (sigma-70 family)